VFYSTQLGLESSALLTPMFVFRGRHGRLDCPACRPASTEPSASRIRITTLSSGAHSTRSTLNGGEPGTPAKGRRHEQGFLVAPALSTCNAQSIANRATRYVITPLSDRPSQACNSTACYSQTPTLSRLCAGTISTQEGLRYVFAIRASTARRARPWDPLATPLAASCVLTTPTPHRNHRSEIDVRARHRTSQ